LFEGWLGKEWLTEVERLEDINRPNREGFTATLPGSVSEFRNTPIGSGRRFHGAFGRGCSRGVPSTAGTGGAPILTKCRMVRNSTVKERELRQKHEGVDGAVSTHVRPVHGRAARSLRGRRGSLQ
jgi:hypothetical protein